MVHIDIEAATNAINSSDNKKLKKLFKQQEEFLFDTKYQDVNQSKPFTLLYEALLRGSKKSIEFICSLLGSREESGKKIKYQEGFKCCDYQVCLCHHS